MALWNGMCHNDVISGRSGGPPRARNRVEGVSRGGYARPVTSSLESVRERFLAVNGRHPMSEADERHIRDRFEPVTDPAVLADMAEGRLPLPAYLLPDGTPVAPKDHRDPAEWAGGTDRLHDWFVRHWEVDEQPTAERAWEAYLNGRYACLTSATPVTIRRTTQLTRQAEEALDRLGDDPRDHVARGSLQEAVDGLDKLLAPTTDYDRARSGGPSLRDRLVTDVRRDHLSPAADPPLPIHTERLLLRRRQPADTDALHDMYGRADVAEYLLAPPLTRLEYEERVRRLAEHPDPAMELLVELDGRVIGDVVLMFRGPTQAETGWTFHPDVAGHGYATEASRAMLDLGFGHYALHRIYAELDARNTASAGLCERLGMRREAHRLADYWSKGEWTDTLQYAVLASEWADLVAH